MYCYQWAEQDPRTTCINTSENQEGKVSHSKDFKQNVEGNKY